MFAKLKKKIAEEAATAPRTGARIPRSASKESITSGGADSGDDFVSSAAAGGGRGGIMTLGFTLSPMKGMFCGV
jgi:hypothetical protein